MQHEDIVLTADHLSNLGIILIFYNRSQHSVHRGGQSIFVLPPFLLPVLLWSRQTRPKNKKATVSVGQNTQKEDMYKVSHSQAQYYVITLIYKVGSIRILWKLDQKVGDIFLGCHCMMMEHNKTTFILVDWKIILLIGMERVLYTV